MIQWMHALSKSWAATLLMGVLTLSFVVWGIGDIFSGSSGTAVATVGRTDVDMQTFQRAYRNFLRNQSQQMGTEISPDMAQRLGLGEVALQQMVSRTALNNEAHKLGLTTPDAAVAQNVRSMAAFRGPSGQFDRIGFVRAIGGAGYTEDQFLQEVREDITREQLTGAVESNFLLPPGYSQALFLYINEKRAADYVIVSPDAAGTIAPPSDAVLTAYVKANANRFSTPEYRDAEFASIGPNDVAAQVSVTDAQIQQEYNAKKSVYVVPEKRDIQQIEFKTQKEATDARAKIASGTSFDALAQQRGLKPDQISLGTLTREDLPDADRAKALFALPLNEVSQPVHTGFGGWVLARVTKIAPDATRTLDDVKEEIRKSLQTQVSANKLVDAANAFSDARGGGDELAVAARKAGMKVGRLQAVDAKGNTPDGTRAEAPADPEFLSSVFSAEVGEDGDPYPTKLGNYFVVKVNGVTPPKLKPLDQVREQAIAAWTAERRSKILGTRTAALAAKAVKDKSLDGIAKELKVSVQKSPALSRSTNDTMFDTAFTQKLFDAAPGGIEFGPQGASGNYIIARVTGIAHPPANPNDPSFAAGAQRLAATVAGDFSIAMANAARASQGVKVNRKLVQSITGTGQ